MKSQNIIPLLILLSFSSCEILDRVINPDKLRPTKIDLGEPTFTVDPSIRIYRVAYTGSKLWAAQDPGSSQSSRVFELNPMDGSIISSIDLENGLRSIDYANGKIVDVETFAFEELYLSHFDPETFDQKEEWYYQDQFSIYYFITFDGENYWAYTNFNCDGFNCQALVAYDEAGNVISSDENAYLEDLLFANNKFWASDGNYIMEISQDLQDTTYYEFRDKEKLGEKQYGNEILAHLEFFDGQLWIIDRFNNFYKTNLN